MTDSQGSPRWTLERFKAAASDRGGVEGQLVGRFSEWVTIHPGATRLGEGPTGPLYFAPVAPDGLQVTVVSIDINGAISILLNDLARYQPFDRAAFRIEL